MRCKQAFFSRSSFVFLWVVILFSHIPSSLYSDEILYVHRDSNWNYFPGLSEASSPDSSTWRQIDFDDGAWETFPSPIGFGDRLDYGMDLSSLEPPMRRNYSTFFVRQKFTVDDFNRMQEFLLRVNYDDGLVVWINGTEVLRLQVDGVAGDPTPFDSKADGSHEQGNWEEYFVNDFKNILKQGENVIACQVFNISITSADCHFNLEALDPFGPDLVPPKVENVTPFPESVIRNLGRIEVTFDEPVTGVTAGDLLINDAPASSVSGEGKGPYIFQFDSPPEGVVNITWAVDTEIIDIAVDKNAFEGGEGWTYLLDSDAPPAQLRINEIMANNTGVILDQDRDESDWIEIVNEGDRPVNLAGYTLSDNDDTPTAWTFPPKTLASGEYLLVYISGKDLSDPEGELHTNFKLSNDGEYLGLFSPEFPPRIVDEIAPKYPEQRPGISWGKNADGQFAYFLEPTPGQENGEGDSFEGAVAQPKFSVERGFFDEAFDLILFSVTQGAQVFFTIDGSVPTPGNGEEFTESIRIEADENRTVVTVRAAAYLEGYLPSKVVTHTYIFPDQVIVQSTRPPNFPTTWRNGGATVAGDYAMDQRVIQGGDGKERALRALEELPSLSVVMDMDDLFGASRGIYTHGNLSGFNWERPCSAELIFADGTEGFQMDSGIRIQGGSSTNPWKSHKLSMRLAFRNDYGKGNLDYKFFEDSSVDEFDTLILDAGLNLAYNHPDHGQRVRAQLVRDQYVADLQEAAGHPSVHGRFVNVFLNGVFWGVYNIHEKPDADFAVSYFGGEKEEWDSIKHTGSNVVDGNSLAFNELRVRTQAARNGFDSYKRVLEYLDIDNFIDYMIVNFYVGNDDWPRHNWYAVRRRIPNAGFKMVSWDAEHVLKNATINQTGVSNGNTPAEFYANLRSNPEFRSKFSDRVERLVSEGAPLYVDPENRLWNEENPDNNQPLKRYMKRIQEIDDAVVLESARWGDLRRPNQPYTRNNEFLAELNLLQRTYFPNRTNTLINQLKTAGLYSRVPAPIADPPSGIVGFREPFTLSLPRGTEGMIYFTLNGADPRVEGTGAVHPNAREFKSSLRVDGFLNVKARILSDGVWSPLKELNYRVSTDFSPLKISEIMYHAKDGQDFDFIEIFNSGEALIDLAGVEFTEGIKFKFNTATILEPKAYLVLVSNAQAFRQLYPDVDPGGLYLGALDNGGERITMVDPDGQVIFSVNYDDDGLWPVSPDGHGGSLILKQTEEETDVDRPEAWASSLVHFGNPGGQDQPSLYEGLVISEVLSQVDGAYTQAIELFNGSENTIDLSRWAVANGRLLGAEVAYLELMPGTEIQSGKHLVLYPDSDWKRSGFQLNPISGKVNLISHQIDPSEALFVVELPYRSQGVNRSFGRFEYMDTTYQGRLQEPSFGIDSPETVEQFQTGEGSPNEPAMGAEVVINEIHYHPIDGDLEFIELKNTTNAIISLHNWVLDGVLSPQADESFSFDEAVIGPQGFLIVCGTDPVFFKQFFEVPEEVPVIGPFRGGLSNNGEWLRLWKGSETGPHALVDEVRFNDNAPWPLQADGQGSSLERVKPTGMSRSPESWLASEVNDGTPGRVNSVSSPDELEGGKQIPGDYNQDATFDRSDVIALLVYQFAGGTIKPPCSGGLNDPLGGNLALLDSNGDARVDLSDSIYNLRNLFLGGPSHILGTPCQEIVGCPDICEL